MFICENEATLNWKIKRINQTGIDRKYEKLNLLKSKTTYKKKKKKKEKKKKKKKKQPRFLWVFFS